jgi:hypothetical protein
VLHGKPAVDLLESMNDASERFDTRLGIEGDRGIIELKSAAGDGAASP